MEICKLYRTQILTGVGVILFLLTGLMVSLFSTPAQREGVSVPAEPQRAEEPQKTLPSQEPRPFTAPAALAAPAYPPVKKKLGVHITGQVNRPGIYYLPAGSRIQHLVEAAGGFTAVADDGAVNLAKFLRDEDSIYIPQMGERRRAQGSPSSTRQTGARTRSSKSKPILPVDINRASEEELMALRGIGPSLARRIIEHRQRHGPFRSVDDLIQVRGIGTSKLKGLRDQAVIVP